MVLPMTDKATRIEIWEEITEKHRHFFPQPTTFTHSDECYMIKSGRMNHQTDYFDDWQMTYLAFSRVSGPESNHGYGLMAYAISCALAVRFGSSCLDITCNGSGGAYNWLRAGVVPHFDTTALGLKIRERLMQMAPNITCAETLAWFEDKAQLRNGTQDLWDMVDCRSQAITGHQKTITFSLFTGLVLRAEHDVQKGSASMARLEKRVNSKNPEFWASLKPYFK